MNELKEYKQNLMDQEKSCNTIEKYLHDVRCFLTYSENMDITPEVVRSYKDELSRTYMTSSANSMLVALNGYLKFIGKETCCVRVFRQQRRMFLEEEKELTRKEYERLVMTAKEEGNYRLFYILQTIAGTGIRIGELKYITVESLSKQRVQIDSKGKIRVIILPRSLVQMLKNYCKKRRIRSGSIFVTKNGNPVDRKNIWAEMKKLCEKANVLKSKVFPHNLRHLFAKSFYEKERDLARLADYLGHSSIETTRRYTMISSTAVCERQLKLGLLFEGIDSRNKDHDIMCIMS